MRVILGIQWISVFTNLLMGGCPNAGLVQLQLFNYFGSTLAKSPPQPVGISQDNLAVIHEE